MYIQDKCLGLHRVSRTKHLPPIPLIEKNQLK